MKSLSETVLSIMAAPSGQELLLSGAQSPKLNLHTASTRKDEGNNTFIVS